MSMRGIYTSVTDIRRKVFTEVARLAYEGGDYSRVESLPYKILPGEEAKYRDSIFLERAIVGERLRLAMGLPLRPMTEHAPVSQGVNESAVGEKYYDPPLVNIIKFACNACPTKQYRVTDGCQGCLAHPCTEVCPKHAVSIVHGKSVIDPEKCILFIQSHVRTHAELAWVLDCYTQFGELSRMTQFKDKSARHPENINCGLFTYPSLMAADILLYQADLVPVGDDQRQHLELTRDIAERFNGIYGNTFTVPDGYYPKLTARVMSLQDPTKKMSKSDDNPKSYISLLDPPATIVKKIKSAVTDSDSLVAYREGKDGINNLMSIYSAVTKKSLEQIENEFVGKGYGDFKQAVGEAVAEALRPIQEKQAQLMREKAFLKECYRAGAEKAQQVS